MSGEETTKPIDPYKLLHIVENDDGTLKRLYEFPRTAAAHDDHDGSTAVITKDVILNPEHNTYVRIFLPRQALDNNTSTTKLPLIVYYRGGGFIVLHVDSTPNHDFCYNMAHQLSAVSSPLSTASLPSTAFPPRTMIQWKRYIGSRLHTKKWYVTMLIIPSVI